jgi:hypothetical protein
MAAPTFDIAAPSIANKMIPNVDIIYNFKR